MDDLLKYSQLLGIALAIPSVLLGVFYIISLTNIAIDLASLDLNAAFLFLVGFIIYILFGAYFFTNLFRTTIPLIQSKIINNPQLINEGIGHFNFIWIPMASIFTLTSAIISVEMIFRYL